MNIGDAHGHDVVELDLAPVEISTDAAIPLSLVVNELLTNALKHGKPPFRVRLEARDGKAVLTVADAGSGPTGATSGTGFGSKIMQRVIRQISARLETSSGSEGYFVLITFPLQVSDESHDR